MKIMKTTLAALVCFASLCSVFAQNASEKPKENVKPTTVLGVSVGMTMAQTLTELQSRAKRFHGIPQIKANDGSLSLLTNLIIPGVNDDLRMIRQMCRWLVENGLADAPLHFSRFFPRYKMADTPPTPLATLKVARQVAEEEGVRRVYLGNV